MPRKHYEYTHIDSVNSLRLTLDFAKLYPTRVVDEAYFILQQKGRHKSEYIVKAIDHYKSCSNENIELKRSLQWINLARNVRLSFGLTSKAAIRRAMTMDINSREYQVLDIGLPHKAPAKMLCGFRITDDHAAEIHKELFNMSANERLLYVSNAVVNYVLDGLDPDIERDYEVRFFLQMINSYHLSKDKSRVLKQYQDLFEMAK